MCQWIINLTLHFKGVLWMKQGRRRHDSVSTCLPLQSRAVPTIVIIICIFMNARSYFTTFISRFSSRYSTTPIAWPTAHERTSDATWLPVSSRSLARDVTGAMDQLANFCWNRSAGRRSYQRGESIVEIMIILQKLPSLVAELLV